MPYGSSHGLRSLHNMKVLECMSVKNIEMKRLTWQCEQLSGKCISAKCDDYVPGRLFSTFPLSANVAL